MRIPRDDGYLLVHGYTGAVDLVNSTVADALRKGKLERLSRPTVVTLRRRGYITDASAADEQDFVKRFASLLNIRACYHVSFVLVVAYDCNFRCSYCFEQKISGNGYSWSHEVFDRDTIRPAFTAMDQIKEGKKRGNKVILYGGEPLMSKHGSIVRSIVAEGKSRGYDFSAVTNGYDLDAFRDLIGPTAIEHLQISVDGGEEAHNRRRKLDNGEGTYRKIMLNVVLALHLGASVNLRLNVDDDNLCELEPLAAEIRKLKLDKSPNFKCLVSFTQKTDGLDTPAVNGATSSGCFGVGAPPRQNSRRQIITRCLEDRRKEDPLFSLFTLPGDRMTDHVREVMATGKGFGFRGTFCGAGRGNVIFDPRGDIYTCWETVGTISERIGRFVPQLYIDAGALSSWRERTVENIKKCLECSYALLCGGGCAMMAKRSFGDAARPYCDGFPIEFRSAARAAYEDAATQN